MQVYLLWYVFKAHRPNNKTMKDSHTNMRCVCVVSLEWKKTEKKNNLKNNNKIRTHDDKVPRRNNFRKHKMRRKKKHLNTMRSLHRHTALIHLSRHRRRRAAQRCMHISITYYNWLKTSSRMLFTNATTFTCCWFRLLVRFARVCARVSSFVGMSQFQSDFATLTKYSTNEDISHRTHHT